MDDHEILEHARQKVTYWERNLKANAALFRRHGHFEQAARVAERALVMEDVLNLLKGQDVTGRILAETITTDVKRKGSE